MCKLPRVLPSLPSREASERAIPEHEVDRLPSAVEYWSRAHSCNRDHCRAVVDCAPSSRSGKRKPCTLALARADTLNLKPWTVNPRPGRDLAPSSSEDAADEEVLGIQSCAAYCQYPCFGRTSNCCMRTGKFVDHGPARVAGNAGHGLGPSSHLHSCFCPSQALHLECQ